MSTSQERLTSRAQPYLKNDEQIQQIFPIQTGPSPWWGLLTLTLVTQLFIRIKIVVVTDKSILVIRVSRWTGRARFLEGRYGSEWQFGPTSGGLWSQIAVPGPGNARARVHRRFYDEVESARVQRLSQPPLTPVRATAELPLAPRQAARSGQAASPGRGRASLLGLTIDPAGRAIAIASSSGVARAEIDRLWNEDVRSNDKQGKWETIYAPEEAGRITAAALVDRDSIVVATGSGELCLKTHDGELRQVFRLEEGEGREQVIDSVLFDPGRKSVIFATGGSVYECLVDGEEASEILEGAAWVEDMALSPGDDLLVANVAGVWELDQDGAVAQVAGTLKFGPCQGLVADRAGDLYVSVAAKRNIVRVSGGRVSRDGFRSGEIVWPPERYGQHVSLVNPGKLALDERGRLYCLDQDIDALVAMDMETR